MKFTANKKFEGKEIEVEKASKTSNGNQGSKKKSKAPAWFVEWFNEFNKSLNTRFDNIEHRMDNLEHRMDNLEHRLDNLVVKNNLKG